MDPDHSQNIVLLITNKVQLKSSSLKSLSLFSRFSGNSSKCSFLHIFSKHSIIRFSWFIIPTFGVEWKNVQTLHFLHFGGGTKFSDYMDFILAGLWYWLTQSDIITGSAVQMEYDEIKWQWLPSTCFQRLSVWLVKLTNQAFLPANWLVNRWSSQILQFSALSEGEELGARESKLRWLWREMRHSIKLRLLERRCMT